MFTQKISLSAAALFMVGLMCATAVTAHAASATVAPGQAIVFSANVSGTAPFTYQWYKDGAAMSGATAATYQISAMQAIDVGSYAAVISNIAGSTTSDNAMISLNSALAITAQPLSQTVTVGASVTFTAAANGTPAPTLQWQYNGISLAGATSASLTLANVQNANAGNYTLVATNTSGFVTSNPATLTVSAAAIAPVITTQPLGQTVNAGNSVTFAATASGTPAPTFQWRKNGVNLSGATSASHTISSVTSGNGGTYSVVATNSAGAATSNGAVLTVNSPPVFTSQPVGLTVTVGASVTFSAAVSGTPAPTYQWRKNGVNLSGATSASYTITGVTTGHAGTYSLVASNVAGSAASNNAVLTVNAAAIAPAITTQPSGQTVTAGASVTFSAAASGTPAPTFQWRKNGVNLSGATNPSYVIAATVAGDAGTYSVVATNSAGSATSSGAVLTVNSAPVFTTQPTNQTVTAGTSVTFSATASGAPALAYQWRKSGVAIAGATSASYTITSTATSDAGTYSVVASNSLGSATSNSATLTVNAAASAPVITSAPATQTVTTGSAVTFKVVATSSATLSYRWYKNGSKIRRATAASYTISTVSSSDAGTYTVMVTNATGSVTSSGAVLTIKAATAPVVYRVDFNADGKSDLLWQNSTTGACSVWLMNGTALSTNITIGTTALDQRICGTGDFNNDGKTDLLWQNTTTGAGSVWLMNGTTVSSTINLGAVTPDWLLRGAGDFNGDGKSDLIWQNELTGECRLWLMAGTTVSNVVSLGLVTTDLIISGTGDFNKDGQSDLLWQNEVTGGYGVWLMAGTTVGSSLTLGTMSLDWQMSGAGDYNADANSDILWQNLLTGECRVWLMSGTTVSSNVALGTVSLDWFLRN